MTTICFLNQKGGCGKSSTCFHLAGALAAAGDAVLLVDVDPQGSLSQGFLGPITVEALPHEQTIAAILDPAVFDAGARNLALGTACPGITLLPANHRLAAANRPVAESLAINELGLRSAIELVDDFDWVLIDCPPNLYGCSWAALLAADDVVIPVPPEDFGTQGLRAVHTAIDAAGGLNPRLRLLGHLVTRQDRRLVIHRAYEKRLRELYGAAVFQTVIPEAAAYKLAVAARQPVSFIEPRSKAATAMRCLAAEIQAASRRPSAQRWGT